MKLRETCRKILFALLLLRLNRRDHLYKTRQKKTTLAYSTEEVRKFRPVASKLTRKFVEPRRLLLGPGPPLQCDGVAHPLKKDRTKTQTMYLRKKTSRPCAQSHTSRSSSELFGALPDSSVHAVETKKSFQICALAAQLAEQLLRDVDPSRCNRASE